MYEQFARWYPVYVDEGPVLNNGEPEFILAQGAVGGDQMEPFVPIFGPRKHFCVSFFSETRGT